jgi:hypothetical protein
VAETVD